MKKIVCLLSLALMMSGCATMQNPKFATTLDEAVIYKTDIGKAMAEKYHNNLNNIYNSINNKFYGKVVFLKEGIGFDYDYEKENDKKEYVRFHFVIPELIYNTLQSNFNKRAATAFSRYGKNLLETIMAEKEISASGEFTGVVLCISWGARNFLESQYYGGEWEGIAIYANMQDCQDFLNFKISNQDFMNKSKILGKQGENMLGKIEIDLKDTM